MTAPLPLRYLGNGRFAAEDARTVLACEHAFEQGQRYPMIEMQSRSANSHRHFFATVNEAWKNLRERDVGRFPTSEHLRKWALISCGYCHRQEFPCASASEAKRLIAIVKAIDEYCLAFVEGDVLVRVTAKSQSLAAMNRDEFRSSKDDVLNFLSSLIDVDLSDLEKTGKVQCLAARPRYPPRHGRSIMQFLAAAAAVVVPWAVIMGGVWWWFH